MQLQMQIICLFLRFQGTEESKSIKHFVGIRLIYFISLVFSDMKWVRKSVLVTFWNFQKQH